MDTAGALPVETWGIFAGAGDILAKAAFFLPGRGRFYQAGSLIAGAIGAGP